VRQWRGVPNSALSNGVPLAELPRLIIEDETVSATSKDHRGRLPLAQQQQQHKPLLTPTAAFRQRTGTGTMSPSSRASARATLEKTSGQIAPNGTQKQIVQGQTNPGLMVPVGIPHVLGTGGHHGLVRFCP